MDSQFVLIYLFISVTRKRKEAMNLRPGGDTGGVGERREKGEMI